MTPAETIYEVAASGDHGAYQWLIAFHGWCHAIDDHVDEEKGPVGVVDIAAQACVLFSASFYQRNAVALAPLVAVVAAQYKASLSEPNARLRDVLRLAGNQVVLAVAYLTGGLPAVDRTNRVLWEWVAVSQL